MSDRNLVLSVDAMGGDHAPESILDGLRIIARERSDLKVLLHGDEARLSAALASNTSLGAMCELRHSEKSIDMDAKPSQAVRSGRGSSMWNALTSVKKGEASVAVSAGNTGALMAMSKLVLRTVEGVHRPAIAAIWPTPDGGCIVLDVGATIEADAEQLVEFAIMGEAYCRAIHGKSSPTLGLLNIGSEELKGRDQVRLAATMLKDPALRLNYCGFVEGNDISMGRADVVVTDGYTGNIALKTAEGTARLVGGFVREALTSSLMAKAGALMARGGLRKLKDRMDPRSVNGGVFLGLNGVVMKSHGGTDGHGFATTIRLACQVASSDFATTVEENLKRMRQLDVPSSEVTVT